MGNGHRARAARRTRLILAAASWLLFTGMVVIVWTITVRAHERDDVTVRICRSQVAQNQVLRRVLLEARHQSIERAVVEGATEARLRLVERAYAPLLRLVPPLECDSDGRPIRREGST